MTLGYGEKGKHNLRFLQSAKNENAATRGKIG